MTMMQEIQITSLPQKSQYADIIFEISVSMGERVLPATLNIPNSVLNSPRMEIRMEGVKKVQAVTLFTQNCVIATRLVFVNVETAVFSIPKILKSQLKPTAKILPLLVMNQKVHHPMETEEEKQRPNPHKSSKDHVPMGK